MTQLCIVITGLWGILFFREISKGIAILQYAAATMLILLGAAMLVKYA